MSNTQELIVLRACTGKTIGEAYKRLSKAEKAYKERLDIEYQRVYNLGIAIECKYILEEIEQC